MGALVRPPARLIALPTVLAPGMATVLAPSPFPSVTARVVEPGIPPRPLRHAVGASRLHPGIELRVVEDAEVSGRAVGALSGDRCLLPRVVTVNRYPIERTVPGLLLRRGDRAVVRRARNRDGLATGILLTGPYPRNWYHWVIDNLPRALLARRLPDGFDRAPLLVPGPVLQHPNFRAALDAVAPHAVVVPLDRDRPVRVGRLALLDATKVAHPEHGDRCLHRGLMVEMRAALLRAAGLDPRRPPAPDPDRRIFIARPETTHRAYNQLEVGAALGARGFVTVEPSRLSLVEQVRLFSSAGVVCGASGSAMTGLLVTGPGARIVMWAFRSVLPKTTLWAELAGIAGSQLDVLPVDLSDDPGVVRPGSYYVKLPAYHLPVDRLLSVLDDDGSTG